jgi:hypothetical protein
MATNGRPSDKQQPDKRSPYQASKGDDSERDHPVGIMNIDIQGQAYL